MFGFNKKTKNKVARETSRKGLQFETLEKREVMAASLTASLAKGVLSIEGTEGNDTIILRQVNNRIQIDGLKTTFAMKDVNSVTINSLGGNDNVKLDTLNLPKQVFNRAISVYAKSGNDYVQGTTGRAVALKGDANKVTVDSLGKMLINGAPPSWQSQNINDEALRQLLDTNLADNVIDRSEMLGIFNQVKKDGKVSAAEFSDLYVLANNRQLFGTNEYVFVLTRDVVVGNLANKTYAGAALGNLAANDSAAKLEKLVGKWFLGTDRPDTKTNGTTFQYTVSAGSLFGANGPQYTDVKQGYVGDCYYVGALAEIAQQDQAAIKNMFIVNGDGTYTVRFFNNGKADYVTVDSQLPVTSSGRLVFANMGQQASSTSNVLWVALAEKAYVQMNASGWLRATGGLPGNGINAYSAIAGGYMSDALTQVTNKTAVNLRIEATADNFLKAFNAGKMIGFATKGTVTNSALVGGHQYTVVGYDATTKKVTVFNPWGVNSGSSKPGLVQLSWAEVVANFQYATVA